MNNSRISSSRSIQNVFVWLLLGLFAVMGTLLMTLGAGVYKDAVDEAGKHSTHRILDAIVRNSVRNCDGQGTFSVETDPESGITCLTITQVYDDEAYCRRLFVDEGWLKESFTEAEMPFSTENGETLCQAETFIPEIKDNLLTVETKDAKGHESLIRIVLRTGGVAK